MSVPKNKRSSSPFEVYENAVKLRVILTTLILKDFGVKNRLKDLKIISKDMPPRLCNEIENLIEQYDIDNDTKVFYEYPQWFLEIERDSMLTFASELVHNILQANKIYITNEEEYVHRRLKIDYAIGICHSILLELRFISDIFHVPLSKMESYIKMVDYEIVLLKNWRQSDNRLLKKI